MTLSIITVNLNNRDGLQRTIDSVVGQTFTDYEWIVIDGGSTDGSRELIEQYADHFTYWCSEPDKGIYNAMNKGIAHAKGKWLQFLNSGDELYDSKTLCSVFSKSFKGDVLYGDSLYIRDSEKIPHICPNTLCLSFLYSDFLNHQATFYKKDIFDTYRYDETLRIYADWKLSLQLLLDGKIFQHIPFFVVNYDFTGLSAYMSESLAKEYQKIKDETIPYHLRIDMEKLVMVKALDFSGIDGLERHKSYNWIMHKTNKKIHRLQKLIHFIESKRR